jgi:DnaK suppressor protein
MIALKNPEYPQLELALRSRLEVLRIQIRDTLLKADADRYAALAEQVHDFKDQALSTLLTDISHAEITRDLEELRDIETALDRTASGTYGQCTQCNAQIPHARLQAYPAAKRCLSCQRQHERFATAYGTEIRE